MSEGCFLGMVGGLLKRALTRGREGIGGTNEERLVFTGFLWGNIMWDRKVRRPWGN